MKVWKVTEIISNSDEALELQLNTLERGGACIKEIILVSKFYSPGDPYVPNMFAYKIIYTIEDVVEE